MTHSSGSSRRETLKGGLLLLPLIAGVSSCSIRSERRTTESTSPGTEDEAAAAAADMTCSTDPTSGFEVCRSADGSIVIFNSGSARIRFRAFRDTEAFPPRWRSGARVTTREVNYQAVQIDSHHYFQEVQQTCGSADPKSQGDRNDDEFASFEWGTLGTEEPIRVKALCRAQWNGKRIQAFVEAGGECFVVSDTDFPDGYPDDWPPLPTITVTPGSMTLNTRPSRPTATGTITVRNTFPDPKRVTIGRIEVVPGFGGTEETGTIAGTFDVTRGDFEVRPNSERQFEVSFTFTGTAQFGSMQAQMPVSWDGGGRTIQLTGARLQEAIDPN